jgi:tetratricopeptide (TPR) repeat protein
MPKSNRLDGLPASAQALAREADAALIRGRLTDAERAITLMLAYAPAHVEPQRLLGLLLHRSGRFAEAVTALRQADAQQPDDPDILIPLGVALSEAGEFSAAIEPLHRAADLRPDAETLYRYGRALEQNAQHDAAAPMFKRAIELDPKHEIARLQYARALFYTGHTEEAVKQFRRLIALGHDVATAWYGLAEIKTVRFDADDLAALKKLRKNPRFAGMERATLLHAIGRAFEDGGDFHAAFDAFAEAARIERAHYPPDRADFVAYIDSVRDAFAQPVSTRGEQGSEAIFIIGMPRAGSTLTEQILAAHSHVEGASELPDLTLAIDRESQRRGKYFPEWVKEASEADWLRIGADYLQSTARWRAAKPRFTDKFPGNWIMAEAAIAMLPKARLIHVRRDPLETSWSCFRQFFAPGSMPWASSFDDVADFLRRCHDHCDYLAARYPDNVRIQSFERLVDDPEGQTRELLAFCGLEFEESCLRFHETARTVRTASAAQVRQPIKKPPSNAERYGALLDPLRKALGL